MQVSQLTSENIQGGQGLKFNELCNTFASPAIKLLTCENVGGQRNFIEVLKVSGNSFFNIIFEIFNYNKQLLISTKFYKNHIIFTFIFVVVDISFC